MTEHKIRLLWDEEIDSIVVESAVNILSHVEKLQVDNPDAPFSDVIKTVQEFLKENGPEEALPLTVNSYADEVEYTDFLDAEDDEATRLREEESRLEAERFDAEMQEQERREAEEARLDEQLEAERLEQERQEEEAQLHAQLRDEEERLEAERRAEEERLEAERLAEIAEEERLAEEIWVAEEEAYLEDAFRTEEKERIAEEERREAERQAAIEEEERLIAEKEAAYAAYEAELEARSQRPSARSILAHAKNLEKE